MTNTRKKLFIASIIFIILYTLNAVYFFTSGAMGSKEMGLTQIAPMFLFFLGFPVAGASLFLIISTIINFFTKTNGELYLFFSLFIFVGLLVFILGINIVIQSIDSYSYKITEGDIISAEMDISTSTSTSNGRRTTSTAYFFKASYKYNVSGKEYIGNKYDIAGVSKSRDEVQKLVERYTSETRIEVFYDEKNPSNAIMIKGFAGAWFFPLIFGFIFMSAGSGFMLLFIKFSKK